jgi:hypothetical protein
MASLDVAPRRRVHDAKTVVVRTAPGGDDRHTHCARINEIGDGVTSPGPDGHVHKVAGCDIQAAHGHAHELAAARCSHLHDARVRHA